MKRDIRQGHSWERELNIVEVVIGFLIFVKEEVAIPLLLHVLLGTLLVDSVKRSEKKA